MTENFLSLSHDMLDNYLSIIITCPIKKNG